MRDPRAVGGGVLAASRRPTPGRPLAIAGLIAMVAGAIDPLEGSVLILAGVALAAAGAVFARSPERRSLGLALALVGFGVGVLFGLSALGGLGGPGGLSNWWGLLLVPYPIGWVLGLVAVFRFLRDRRGRGTSHESVR